MAPSLVQIESKMDHFDAELIELHEGIQDAAAIVDLILAGEDTPRSKSRRLKIVRKATQRTRAMIALVEDALDDLEEQRRHCLACELDD